MSPTVTIWHRECRVALGAVFSWVIFAGTTALTGLLFTVALHDANGSNDQLPAVFCTQLLLTVCIPVALFTMRMFAEERASGTLETLMTAPVTDRRVVLGKFLGALTMTCVSLFVTCMILPIYMRLAAPPPFFSRVSLYGGLALVFLFAASSCAMGILLSLLSRHQAQAAIATTIAVLVPAALFSGTVHALSPAGSMFAIFDLTDFARGTADTRVIVGLVSATVFLLFCAIRVLESRRWSAAK